MNGSSTVVLLIRHAHTDAIGTRLVSRLPGVSLNAAGRVAATRLGTVLARELISAVYSSPLERGLETAQRIADARAVPLHACDGLNEVDFGEWTGKTFVELNAREDWRRFNEHRGSAMVPAGESAIDVQSRVLSCIAVLHDRHPGETVAAVSHADVIRPALLHYMGLSLDDWQQIEIAPGTVSAISVDDSGGRVLYINRSSD